MFNDFDLSKLPSLPFSQRDRLPDCPAVYFVVDSENRVLYIGQAIKLLTRWKDHHRFEQINKINSQNPIKLVWMTSDKDKDFLLSAETYFIELYQPLLNKTSVPAKEIIPSEIVLKQTLTKISKYIIIFGFDATSKSNLPTVYLKYDWLYRSPARTLKSIFSSDNKKPTGLRWKEYIKRENSFWKALCNGVAIDVAPWTDIQDLRKNSVVQKLAGVEMLAICEPELRYLLNNNVFLKENSPGLSILEHDPIPLLW